MSMPIIQILISNYLMKATKTLWKVIDFDIEARNTHESLEHLVMLEIILKKEKGKTYNDADMLKEETQNQWVPKTKTWNSLSSMIN